MDPTRSCTPAPKPSPYVDLLEKLGRAARLTEIAEIRDVHITAAASAMSRLMDSMRVMRLDQGVYVATLTYGAYARAHPGMRPGAIFAVMQMQALLRHKLTPVHLRCGQCGTTITVDPGSILAETLPDDFAVK